MGPSGWGPWGLEPRKLRDLLGPPPPAPADPSDLSPAGGLTFPGPRPEEQASPCPGESQVWGLRRSKVDLPLRNNGLYECWEGGGPNKDSRFGSPFSRSNCLPFGLGWAPLYFISVAYGVRAWTLSARFKSRLCYYLAR